MRKIAVYVSFMNDRYRAQLRTAASEQGFDLDFYDCSRDSAALLDRIGDYEIIYGHPDPAWLKRADRLRWLCSDFAGVEKYLDEAIWPSQGCLLSNSSGAYGPAIAEHIVMVLLMLLRRMPEYEEVVRNRGWSNQLPIRSIRDNAFTLLGTGNIGVNVAQRLRGMGAAKITGLSRSGQAVPGFDEVYPISRLEEILPSVKVLVMSLPGTPETIHILNRDRIALLPPDAYVINVGRGPAIEQEPLIEALNSGHLAGAALDVMDPEPLPPDHPLWSARNLILTPHVSGNMTLGYTCDVNVEMFCADLLRYGRGEPLKNLVDRTRGY